MVGFPRRLLESFGLPILLTVLCMLASEANILPGSLIPAGGCILAILIVNYLNMTDHLFAVRRENVFYKTNFAVFGINFAYSMLMTIIEMCFGIGDIYLFLCLPYAILDFLGMPLIVSVLFVNAIFALEVFLMPYIAVKRRR